MSDFRAMAKRVAEAAKEHIGNPVRREAKRVRDDAVMAAIAASIRYNRGEIGLAEYEVILAKRDAAMTAYTELLKGG